MAQRKKRVFGVERVVHYDPATGLLGPEDMSVTGGVLNLAVKVARLVSKQHVPQAMVWIDPTASVPTFIFLEKYGGTESPTGGHVVREETEWSHSMPLFATTHRALETR